MSEEELKINLTDEQIEAEIQKLHENLKFYLGLQRELIIRRYGRSEHIDDWERYSAEFSEAFDEVVASEIKNDLENLERIRLDPLSLLEKINKKIDFFHGLELKLMKHIDKNGKVPMGFEEWHEEFGKILMKVIHNKPELKGRLEGELSDEVLREVEDVLYMEEEAKKAA